MRHPRLKPDCHDTWHHCYNRAVGFQSDRPFSTADKEQFVRILHRVAQFYTVHIVGYQFMSNHFHLVALAPAAQPAIVATTDTKTAALGTVGANDTLFTTSFRRRMRCWNDGLIIGSEHFVRNMVARYRPALADKKTSADAGAAGRNQPVCGRLFVAHATTDAQLAVSYHANSNTYPQITAVFTSGQVFPAPKRPSSTFSSSEKRLWPSRLLPASASRCFQCCDLSLSPPHPV